MVVPAEVPAPRNPRPLGRLGTVAAPGRDPPVCVVVAAPTPGIEPGQFPAAQPRPCRAYDSGGVAAAYDTAVLLNLTTDQQAKVTTTPRHGGSRGGSWAGCPDVGPALSRGTALTAPVVGWRESNPRLSVCRLRRGSTNRSTPLGLGAAPGPLDQPRISAPFQSAPEVRIRRSAPPKLTTRAGRDVEHRAS